MFSIENKQAIKRIIAGVTKPFHNVNDNELSVILNYHSVHPEHRFATTPDDFSVQMKYLADNFSIIGLPDFSLMRSKGRDIPARTAIVTFDDGFEDNYTYAFPVLKELEIPATVFLTTGFINRETKIDLIDNAYNGLAAMDWEQIREMKAHGISFGAHTHTHRILTEISLEQAEKEIVTSKEVLEDKLGEPVHLFAYPLGQPHTYNEAIVSLLKKHDFDLSCSTLWGHDNSSTDMFALQRIRIDACDTLSDFKDKINGKWDFIRWFQKQDI